MQATQVLTARSVISFSPPVTVLADPLVVKARESAHLDFVDHTRKVPRGSPLTLLPYVVHLEDVAGILADYGYGAKVVAAAYLHDHLEDLPKLWNFERLSKEYGLETATLVNWVTQQDKGGSWEDRNRAYAERLVSGPDEALALSLADKLSNLRSCNRYLQMGFPVESVLKRGWEANSAKFHALNEIYEGRVPVGMLREYRQALARFDELGPKVSAVM